MTFRKVDESLVSSVSSGLHDYVQKQVTTSESYIDEETCYLFIVFK
jgi:hypothetical protein